MAVGMTDALNQIDGEVVWDGAHGCIKDKSVVEPHPSHVGLLSVVSKSVQSSPF